MFQAPPPGQETSGAGQAGSDVALILDSDGRRVTRIIRDAAGKTLTAIARQTREPEGGAPSVSAVTAVRVLAAPGVREFSSIVAPPFTSVLALGEPRRAPVEAADGGVGFVSQMTVTLSCEARAIDDMQAAALLAVFKSLVENPVTALI